MEAKQEEAQQRIVFDQTGDFAALYTAQDWCRQNGISYGSTQSGAPTGLMRGDYAISKWRNLSADEIAALDGAMTGDMRNGPVTITLKAGAAEDGPLPNEPKPCRACDDSVGYVCEDCAEKTGAA